MKSIKHHLLGLLLAVIGIANASASALFTDTFFVPADMGAGTSQTFAFAGGDASAQAGDSFVYDFLFNTPPPNAGFSFSAAADDPASLMFSGIGLFAGDQTTSLFGLTLTLTDFAASGWGVLDSGVYDLRFSGNFLGAAGGFTGSATADPAYVPEPASLALLVAGVIGIAAVRRRAGALQARPALAAC